MEIKLIIIPFITGFIGWVTNKVALILLFHPYKRFCGMQGVLPKQQQKIAENISNIFKEQIDVNKFAEEFIATADWDEILPEIAETVYNELGIWKYLIPDFKARICEILSDFIENIDFNELIKWLNPTETISLLIFDKINSYSMKDLEKTVKEISNRELKFIELSGGILGFIIGLIQSLIQWRM